jgi:hypothetical protein
VTAEEQARAAILAHELAAIRNPRKAREHLVSAQWYREQYGIEDETTFPTWTKTRYLKS